MKIDYDELRRDAVAFIESNKIASFYTFSSIPPEKMLRLLEIIEVAKKGLAGEICSDETCRHDECVWSRGVLNAIAKLENGE